MAKSIQIRNVPDSTHRILKARADAAGLSLSAYLLEEIRHLAIPRPTLSPSRARVAAPAAPVRE